MVRSLWLASAWFNVGGSHTPKKVYCVQKWNWRECCVNSELNGLAWENVRYFQISSTFIAPVRLIESQFTGQHIPFMIRTIKSLIAEMTGKEVHKAIIIIFYQSSFNLCSSFSESVNERVDWVNVAFCPSCTDSRSIEQAVITGYRLSKKEIHCASPISNPDLQKQYYSNFVFLISGSECCTSCSHQHFSCICPSVSLQV
jgi:hypothetical protein